MIYIATSWKNPHIDGLTDCLDQWNINYFDFRVDGFHWSQINPNYSTEPLNPHDFRLMLRHPLAQKGYLQDFTGMKDCIACILLLPSNRSAHLEAGWFVGANKPVAIYLKEKPIVPELMYNLVDLVTGDIQELMEWSYRNGTHHNR